MNYRGLLLLLFFALYSFVSAQSITITDPHSGDIWQKNIRQTIRWNVRGEMNNKVKIRLFNREGRVKVKDIVNNTDNNGSYRCPAAIFNSVPDGEYIIKVKTIDDRFFGDSNVFSIGNLSTEEPDNPRIYHPIPDSLKKNNLPILKRNMNNIPRSIKITFPPKGHVWDLRLGDKGIPFPIYVMWKKIGNWDQNSRVIIALVGVTNPIAVILSFDTANNGLFTGEIKRMDYGNKLLNPYTIVIQSSDKKLLAQSPTFYIRNDVYRLD